MYEELDDVTVDTLINHKEYDLWIDRALRHHSFPTNGFRNWLKSNHLELEEITEDDIYEYHDELGKSGQIDNLLTQISNEVFFLLFGNRKLLERLNNYIANTVRSIEMDELESEDSTLLFRNGFPARAHIPQWVCRAVYFRDRGICVVCNTDLSGLLSIQNNKHFDHIIPLANGGINDVTNIQLLCQACNLKKGQKLTGTFNHYETWYKWP